MTLRPRRSNPRNPILRRTQRPTNASHIVSGGMSLAIIKRSPGRTASSTLRRYAHPGPHSREADETMGPERAAPPDRSCRDRRCCRAIRQCKSQAGSGGSAGGRTMRGEAVVRVFMSDDRLSHAATDLDVRCGQINGHAPVPGGTRLFISPLDEDARGRAGAGSPVTHLMRTQAPAPQTFAASRWTIDAPEARGLRRDFPSTANRQCAKSGEPASQIPGRALRTRIPA